MKKIALVGATGNVAGRALEKLVEAGAEVVALVRHPEKVPESLRSRVRVEHGNLEDGAFVARTTREGSMILNQRLCVKLGLTARQQQLVAFLARGFTNKEIAESMGLSEFTVKNHVHRIMRQLNADSRYAAVQTVCGHNLPATI